MRKLFLLLSTTLITYAHSQQFDLAWATATENAVSRVKFAANGDLFALSSGNNGVKLQRYNGDGLLLWTKTLNAPDLTGLDMDVDGSDNVFLYLGFTTGQLDLDPGPFTSLVDPGKVYAKYTGSGQFQWGFSLANSTDLSSAYGGISCDNAGNLYIAGNLGMGEYDMDPGPGVHNVVVPTSTTGIFIARYRPDGTLHWANMRQWANGFNYTRAIAAIRNGAGFYVVQRLDNGGASVPVDVDPGPGTVEVSNGTINLLRYDSSFAFVARASVYFGEQKLAADDDGKAYLLASAYAGGGQWAMKYSTSGQVLNQVYQTALPGNGNIRLAGIVPDGQGGSMGAYSTNCTANYYRFFKMNVSGLVDHSYTLYSGTDCTYPIVRGFALRGSTFAIASFNQGYPVDFDPALPVVSLPTGTNRGVVALYGWCGGAPYEPFGIQVVSEGWCIGDTVALAVDAFGDATSYTWDVGAWELVEGQGSGEAYLLATTPGPTSVAVTADNGCGSSAPVTADLSAGVAMATLPNDSLACGSMITVLDPGMCQGCTYVWEPGGATTPTLAVELTESAVYSVTATHEGCSVTDSIALTIEVCTGMEAGIGTNARLYPVPAVQGETLYLTGVPLVRGLRITTLDGRAVQAPMDWVADRIVIQTRSLAPGVYLLHGVPSRVLPLVVR